MRRKRRQFIAMVLAVCLLAGMLPVSVRAEGEGSFDAVGGKVTYRVDGDSITITGCEDTVTAIEFPDTIEGMPVKTIEDRAFWGNTSLTSVAFPENLTSLGEEVFYQCGSLENVDFSSCTSLTEIKWGSFCETGLTSLTLPDSVVTIQDQAFAECSQLTSLDLGDGVQFIGANAFWGAGITSLTLPDSLATLEDFAFAYCESLTSIEWPDNEDFTTVTGFGGCTALPVEEFNEVVSLPSVTALGTEAFSYCTFESVTIPSGIRTIGEGAFWGADSMKSLTIMPGVTYIESDAFANCSGLAGTTIVVPETVISIGGNAFGGCAKEQQMTDEEGFIYYAFTEVTVEIRNRDFSLSPKSDYYSYAPVTIDGTDYENPFGNATVIRAYETDSQGNPSMLYRLYEVLKDVEIYPDSTQHKQKAYRFEALTDAAVYTVSGSIPEGASVLLRRDGQEIPVTVTGNWFSAEVTSGADVSVTVKLDGYYDKYFLPESGSVLTGDWDLGNITLEKIPQNRSMSVDFDGGTVKDFQGLEFTLKAGNRTLEEGTDYTLQYPYIILSESLEEEELTLSVNADSLGYTGGSVTAKRAEGTFVLPLTPWGKLHITTAGTFAGDNHILVFNQKGELVGKSTVSKDGMYITDGLKAGSYEIIAYNANSSFASVSTIHALEALGLSEGRDYAKMTAEVSDNRATEAEITVPLLKTDISGILDKEKCAVSSGQNTAFVGLSLTVKVYYGFTDDEGGSISVTLPEDTEIQYICSENARLQKGDGYLLENDTVMMNTSKKEGVFYLTVAFSKKGDHSIAAAATKDGMTAPIGSAAITVQEISLCPDTVTLTALKGNSVLVTTAPDTNVLLFLDGEEAARGRTNKLGKVRLSYDLPDSSVGGQTFELKTQAQEGGTSAVATVSYVPSLSHTELQEWSFRQKGWGTNIIYSADDGIGGSYYTYVADGSESDSYWTISAEFKGYTAPEQVISYLGMLDGSVKEVPLTLISEKAAEGEQKVYTFAGELYFPTVGFHEFIDSQIPQDFALNWQEDGEDYSYTEYAFEQSQKKAEELMKEREALIAQAKEEVLGDEAETTELVDLSEWIFGAKYRASGEEWFQELPAEGQQVIRDWEKAVDAVMEDWTEVFGLPKNLTEYGSFEEALEGIGITLGKNSRTKEELRADGFVICESGDTFTAYKDYDLAFSEENIELADEGDGGRSGFVFVNGDGTVVDFKENAEGNWDVAAAGAGLGMVGTALDAFSSFWNKYTGATSEELATFNKGATGFSRTLQAAGVVLGFYAAYQNAHSYRDYTLWGEELDGYIDELKLYEDRYAKTNYTCSSILAREQLKAMALRTMIMSERSRTFEDSMVGGFITTLGITKAGTVSGLFGIGWDANSNMIGDARAVKMQKMLDELNQLTLERKMKCEKTDMEEIMNKVHVNKTLIPILDPSGIVYEAVESNPLSGVTATVWYADDENGTNAQIWNAREYDQLNPQITDKTGMYAWDVPVGWWQVRFEKDGYETAATDWMQVPPPRMNLKTAMVSSASPEVVSVNAYPDYIEVLFSQYMDTAKKITLPDGMSGEWQNIEDGFSKILHVKTTGGFSLGDSVSFTIDGAQNYAGNALSSYNSGKLTVSARPAEIILDYENVISAKVGTEPDITVRIKDSQGNYMEGVNVEAEIGDTQIAALADAGSAGVVSVVTDADGKAIFPVKTMLPGYTGITFRVAGTGLERTSDLHVTVDENRPQRPTAVVGDTTLTKDSPKENYVTVKKGATLSIEAEEGVTIYYTTDDTCPCQNSESRKIYTAPIEITENTKYRIAAYKDGMDYSERLNITVTVEEEGPDRPQIPIGQTLPFTDVAKADWYYDAVYYNYFAKTMTGLDATHFGPADTLARAQFAVILHRMNDTPKVTYKAVFPDVPEGIWFTDAILWAADTKVVTGYSDTGKFGPADKINREQMAVMMYRYANYKKYDTSQKADFSKFVDAAKVSTFAEEAMQWAVGNGIITGKDNGTRLDPQGNATRAECAAIIQRFIEKYGK